MTATNEVIERAYQKADEQGGLYRLAFRGGEEWTVTHTAGKSEYGVITRDGAEKCTCKAFEYDGFCKHLALCLVAEHYDARAEEAARPIDCAEIDPFAYLTAPRIAFPIADIPAYQEAANLPNLTAAEREELTYDFDRLYKRTI